MGLPWGYSLNYTTAGAIKLVSGFSDWIGGSGLSGSAALAGADPDHDGISNGMEYVLGGNPATESNLALLPTLTPVTADMGNGSRDYLKFTCRVTQASVNNSVVTDCQYATDLTNSASTTAVNGAAGVVIVTTVDGFTSGINMVEVWLPMKIMAVIMRAATLTVPGRTLPGQWAGRGSDGAGWWFGRWRPWHRRR